MSKKQTKNRTIHTDNLIRELTTATEFVYDAQLEMMELAASNYLKSTKHMEEIEISEEKKEELKDQFKKYDNDTLIAVAIAKAENLNVFCAGMLHAYERNYDVNDFFCLIVNVVIKNLESCLYEMCRRDGECNEDEL